MSHPRSQGTAVAAAEPTLSPEEDDAVVARLDMRLFRLLLDAAPDLAGATVLDHGCRTGRSSLALVEAVRDGGRVLAVEPDEGMRELARRRLFSILGQRVFLKGDPLGQLSLGDGVVDAVVANRAFDRGVDVSRILRELRRVCAPGAPLLVTHLASGTFQEVQDLIVEAGLKLHRPDVVAAARTLDEARPRVDQVGRTLEAAGFRVERYRETILDLRLQNARSLRADPVFRCLGGPERAAAGEPPDTVLDAVQDALDTYLDGAPPSLEIRAGILRAVPAPR